MPTAKPRKTASPHAKQTTPFSPTSGGPTSKGPVTLLLGTQKGAFTLKSDAGRANWKLSRPELFGSIINHMVADPRDKSRKIQLLAARTGHLGPTVFRTLDGGKTWQEASKPPAYPRKKGGKSVEATFWLTAGHASEPGVWYGGTIPAGLFITKDNGDTWEPVKGFNSHKNYDKWLMEGEAPGGQMTHSILIDPRDPKRIFLGVSAGGTFKSTDKGKDWQPWNKKVAADFIPTPDPEFGHDPHCMVQSQLNPDRIYMQNHCGIYRLTQPSDTWERIGDNMPRAVGDVGFPILVHPRDPETIWVVPMDGTSVWPRTSVDGKPAVYRSKNAGDKWQRLTKGLPKTGWHTVFRQSFSNDAHDQVGLYFGTTSGEIWASTDEGDSWTRIAEHLPRVLSVEVQ